MSDNWWFTPMHMWQQKMVSKGVSGKTFIAVTVSKIFQLVHLFTVWLQGYNRLRMYIYWQPIQLVDWAQ